LIQGRHKERERERERERFLFLKTRPGQLLVCTVKYAAPVVVLLGTSNILRFDFEAKRLFILAAQGESVAAV